MNPDPMFDRRDRGTVLPLVLFFVLILGLVLASMARYTGTNLRYSTVVEQRASASAAAEAAVRYGIQRVESNSVTSCENGPVPIVPMFDASVDPVLGDADHLEITCDRLDAASATLSGWTAVVTGEGISGTNCTVSTVTDCRFLVDDHGAHAATGRIFLPSLRQPQFRINIQPVEFEGNLFYDGSSDGCATIDRYDGPGNYDDDIVLTSGQFVCWPQTWQDVVQQPPIPGDVLTSSLPVSDPNGTDVNGCRVFEPGRYTSLNLDIGGHNYFKSGIYDFDDVDIDTGGFDTYILGGFPPDERFDTRLIVSNPCTVAQAADGLSPGPSPTGISEHGVTWYFSGNTKLTLTSHTTIELLPKLHSDGTREHAVSIQVVGNAGGEAIRMVAAGAHNHIAVHGQIWAPYRSVDLRETVMDFFDAGPFTSGIVAAQLFIDSTPATSAALGPDRTQSDHELLITSTATVDGVTIEARAVVEHRPGETPGNRVAVRSIRIGD